MLFIPSQYIDRYIDNSILIADGRIKKKKLKAITMCGLLANSDLGQETFGMTGINRKKKGACNYN